MMEDEEGEQERIRQMEIGINKQAATKFFFRNNTSLKKEREKKEKREISLTEKKRWR